MPVLGRIRRRAAFDDLRRAGRRVRSGPVTVTWRADPAAPLPSVAYAVGRRVGPAVARNLVRRRLRSAMVELRPHLQPGDYLLTASPALATCTYSEMRTSVFNALERLHRSAP